MRYFIMTLVFIVLRYMAYYEITLTEVTYLSCIAGNSTKSNSVYNIQIKAHYQGNMKIYLTRGIHKSL